MKQETVEKIKATCKSIEYFEALTEELRDDAAMVKNRQNQEDIRNLRAIVIVAIENLEERLLDYLKEKED